MPLDRLRRPLHLRAFGSLRNLARSFLETFRRAPIPDPKTLRRFLDEPTQVRLDSS